MPLANLILLELDLQPIRAKPIIESWLDILLEHFIDILWYRNHPVSLMLLPLAWGFRVVAAGRRLLYAYGILPTQILDIPVVVVGNISVGGTGKTPLVIWLVAYLRRRGFRPGVVSRGYRGQPRRRSIRVRTDSDATIVGDEPLLIARRAHCPVAIATDRATAARQLIVEDGVDVILCDDGLQHIALARDIEIAVIDGERRHGNGRCLPAGPLREPPSRLRTVDLIVCNGKAQAGEFEMRHQTALLRSLGADDHRVNLATFRNQSVHAVAGVGNPARFFERLAAAGLRVVPHRFPDHYRFQRTDIFFDDGLPVIMTEKDAVKCAQFASGNQWYLPITAEMTTAFEQRLTALMEATVSGQKIT